MKNLINFQLFCVVIVSCLNFTSEVSAQSAPQLLWAKISGSWPSEFDGSFSTIAVNPSNSNIILVGSGVLGPGIFKSTNGGSTWVTKNTGIQELGLFTRNYPSISKIVYSRSNPNVVYFGTVSDDLIGDIYKSIDGGESWQKIDGRPVGLVYQIQGAVYDLDVSPTEPNTVYAGVTGAGIMKTSDGGANWSTVFAAGINSGAQDYFNVVRVLPTQPETVLFSGFTYYTDDSIPVPNPDFEETGSETTGTTGLAPFPLRKSTDGGTTWNSAVIPWPPLPILSFLPAIGLITDLQYENSSGDLYFSTIAYQTPDLIFIGNKGIYKSSDLGSNWQPINQAPFENLDQLPFPALLTNPSSANGGVFASGGLSTMLVGSIDGGNHWLNLDPSLYDAFIGRGALAGNKLFILTSVGIYSADVSSLFSAALPVIASVSPNILTGVPLPQTQLIRIIGSGFTSSSTLIFNDGVDAPFTGRVPAFISANELDYSISVGTSRANWTAQVVNGSQISNLGYFTVNPPSTTSSGSLVVDLFPAGAVSAGAQWQVDVGAYSSSGGVVPALAQGSHTVSFKSISDYATPANQTVNISANAQTTMSATYAANAPSTCLLTLNYNSTQGGASPSPSASGNIYTAGEIVQLYATTSAGYHFTGWSGNASGTNNPTTIVMDGSKSVTASFAPGDPNMGTAIITIQPPEAVAAGVTWGFNDNDFRASGTGYTDYPRNFYVYLHGTNNWTGALAGTVTITAGQTTNYTFVSSYTGGQIVGNDPRTYLTLAGSVTNPGIADGVAGAAQFLQPWSPAIDSVGNIYVLDVGPSTIRKITPQGAVSTFAGQAGIQGSADGVGTNATFSNPYGLAIDSSNNLYVADTGNQTIRKITPAGTVSTIAGLAGSYGNSDGTGNAALFGNPRGIAVGTNGNVYIADTSNETIRRMTPAGVVTTIAGLVDTYGTADGAGNIARFNFPAALTVDASGNIYVADDQNSAIRKVTPSGVTTTLAGFTGSSGAADGTGNAARFNIPTGIAIDASGNIYVADNGNNAIREVSQAGTVTTMAGLSGDPGSSGGIGSAVRFHFPSGVAVDASGNLFITDSQNHAIRVTQPLTAQVDQTISFDPLPNISAGNLPFALTATASSGLPVYFSILAGPAVLDTNNILTLLGAGTVKVVSWQPGNTDYNAAAPVQQSFNVSPIPQTIAFGALSQQNLGDAPFPLSATADSGLPASFSLVSGPATLIGNILILNGWGTVTVSASQLGNKSYSAATSVTQSFFVIPPYNVIVSPQLLPKGNFQLAFYGLMGSNYLVQVSTNLINWQTFTNFTGSNSVFYLNDSAAANFNERFYRMMP